MMHTRPDTENSRLHALTGVRGVAALGVVGYHFNTEFQSLIPGWSAINWLVTQGGLGVDFFFLLSGFILTHTYWNKFLTFRTSDYLNFVWLRFARIYPAYLAALLAALAIVWVARLKGLPYNPTAYPADRLLPEFLMILGWLGDLRLGWNYPDWSVSAEWFAYLFVFPFAIRAARKTTSPWILFALLLLPVGLFALSLAAPSWPVSRHLWMVSNLFFAGCIVRALRNQIANDLSLGRYADVLCAGCCLVLLALHAHINPAIRVALIHLSFAALILALSLARGPVVTLLSSKVAVYLGEISYSIYLSHAVIQRCLKVALPPTRVEGHGWLTQLAVGITYWIVIFVAAAALYHLIEKPGREFLRRLYGGSKPQKSSGL